jgi:adenine-specific DNA glycosylase
MAGFWDLPAPEELPRVTVVERLGSFRHTITHHHYTLTVLAGRLGRGGLGEEFGWFAAEELGGIPLSTTARKGLRLDSWSGNEN